MSIRRLWPVLLLVPLGLVAGHQVSYAAAGPTVSTHGHGHLAQLVLAAIPLAVAGTVGLADRVRREQVVAALALLAGIQIVAFAAMEAVEGLAGGADVTALVRSPRLWAGVAIQIAVALGLGFTLRGAGRVAFHLLARRPATANAHLSRPVGAPSPAGQATPRPLAVTRWLQRRGPPILLPGNP